MPAALVEHARRFYASGGTPVVPRLAATVVLMRPGLSAGLEVYLIRRADTMAFASGMYAFPGGSVDPRDAAGDVDWSGPSDVDWSRRLGQPPDRAQAVVCAAVRELFEESGVLLAALDDVTADEWEAARRALIARELSLADLLRARDLPLRSDLLVTWARWITPEFEPRRYDTYFFLAVVPPGQLARNVSGEADHVIWARPADALELPMLPPTFATLRQLSAYSTPEGALAASVRRNAATPVDLGVPTGTTSPRSAE